MAVTDNTSLQRFELHEAGALAFADYRRSPGVLTLPHVEAAPALRGTGAAGRLMEGVLDMARAEGVKVQPLCAYAAAYMRRHPRWRDLEARAPHLRTPAVRAAPHSPVSPDTIASPRRPADSPARPDDRLGGRDDQRPPAVVTIKRA